MNLKSLGNALQIAAIIVMVFAPIPNIVIYNIIAKPGDMDQMVLYDYRVKQEQFAWIMLALLIIGAVMLLVGRHLKKRSR